MFSKKIPIKLNKFNWISTVLSSLSRTSDQMSQRRNERRAQKTANNAGGLVAVQLPDGSIKHMDQEQLEDYYNVGVEEIGEPEPLI